MTEKYLLESGVIRVKDAKFEKPNEEAALYEAYLRLIAKELSGESENFSKFIQNNKDKGVQGVPAFLVFHEEVVKAFKESKTSPEGYREALMLEKLEDNVAKHLSVYMQSRQRVEFIEACLAKPQLYNSLCNSRGKDCDDKGFRKEVENLYSGMTEKFSELQTKFFDEFVEFNVREDVRFSAVNEKLLVKNA